MGRTIFMVSFWCLLIALIIGVWREFSFKELGRPFLIVNILVTIVLLVTGILITSEIINYFWAVTY